MRARAIFPLWFATACGLLDNTQRRLSSYPQHKITASDAAAYAQFGWSVAKSGDVIVVGAVFFDDIDDHSNQAVYVYRTSDGGATYDEIAKLTAAALAWDSGFGNSVAIDGDTIVVGTAYKATVYIFRIADGGVKEEGSHDELCAKGGVYAGLVRKQLTKAAAVLDQGKEDAAEAKAANDTIDKLLG